MRQCKLCGRKGLFLSLGSNGLCNGCEEFFVLDLKNRVRIIDDCLRLITNSKNIDTRLKRCDLLEEQAKVLLEYQRKGILITGGVNPSDLCLNCKAMREEIIREKIGMKINWRKSKAHLLLLSKFIHANSFEAFAKQDYWKNMWDSVLGEPSQKAIKRFVDEGMLMAADLNDLLSLKYKVNELKDMLKQRGLPISGRKEEMIQSLAQADPNGMKKAVAELSLLKCTQRGHEIAEQYLEAEKEKRAQVERQVMEYIVSRKFKEAILMVDALNKDEVFREGFTVKIQDRINELNVIFENIPKILVRLGNEKLETLRIEAAMMALGVANKAKKWLPADLEPGLHFDNDTAARMFNFFAVHRAKLEQYRREGVEYVEIFPAPYSCESCKKLAGKHYKLDDAPELPNPDCTDKMGCRCCFLPVV